MSVIKENIKINIKEITKTQQSKGLVSLIYIEGICKATTEDENFEFEFKYQGNTNENPQKILCYLENMAQNILIERQLKQKQPTLSDYINGLIKKEIN